jgi:hypothetical protein
MVRGGLAVLFLILLTSGSSAQVGNIFGNPRSHRPAVVDTPSRAPQPMQQALPTDPSIPPEQRFATYLDRFRRVDVNRESMSFSVSVRDCLLTAQEIMDEPISRPTRWDGTPAEPYVQMKELTFSITSLDDSLISRSGDAFKLYFPIEEGRFSRKIKLSEGNNQWTLLPPPPLLDGNRGARKDTPQYESWSRSYLAWLQQSSKHTGADIRGFEITTRADGRVYVLVSTPSVGLAFQRARFPTISNRDRGLCADHQGAVSDLSSLMAHAE